MNEHRLPGTHPGQMMMIAESALSFGQDHPGAAANARKTDRDGNIEELAASIEAQGILQALLVWSDEQGPTRFWVVDGSRRLKAIRKLIAEGRLKSENDMCQIILPCVVFEGGTATEAMEKSLTANITQLPLDPVDQYETFAEIFEAMKPKEGDAWNAAAGIETIARRFATTPVIVERRLALGHLHPDLREAIRSGDLPLDGARAFTLEPDPAAQLKIFKDFTKKKFALNAFSVRQAILGKETDAGKLLNFVGRQAYLEAGGFITRDLFSEDGTGDGVSDYAKLCALTADKLEAECENLREDGWSWAEPAATLPHGWDWSWEKLTLKKKPSADDKARSGCAVGLDNFGNLQIVYGVVKPKVRTSGAATKAADSDKADDEPSAPRMPKALQAELQRAASLALPAAVLKSKSSFAVAAMLAALHDPASSPFRFEMHGLDEVKMGGDFTKLLPAFLKKPAGANLNVLASIVATSINLPIFGSIMPMSQPGVEAIAKALGPKLIHAALSAAFHPEIYFEAVAKSLCVAAVTEALGAEHGEKAEKLSKAELAKFCIANVPKTGWLPPELRWAGYPKGKKR